MDKKPKVLIVDDYSSDRQLLAAYLAEDYEVREAKDGKEAVEMIAKDPPDIVLLDILMPHMDGFQVCRHIKSDRNTALIPVILCTTMQGREDTVKGIEAGADEFLIKPIDRTELMVRINSLLRLKTLTDQLEDMSSILFMLAYIVEAKDKSTERHLEKMAEFCLGVGKVLNLSPAELEILRKAAVLHDIGKIGIDDSILKKPAPLTPEEKEKIKKHCEIGERICQPLRNLRDILDIIRHHHERLDGSGYPDRLKGTEISYLARILSVCDIYEAFTSDRSYRKAYTQEDALAIMEEEVAKGWWDPEVMKALKQFLSQQTTSQVTA